MLIEYNTIRNDTTSYIITMPEMSVISQYCPREFPIDYNSKSDDYSFRNDAPANKKDFEIRKTILIDILRKENKEWQNIKWKVDPDSYPDSF